jgi:hypothetical protein
MDAAGSPTVPSPRTAQTAGASLRWWGILALVMFLLTSAVGGSLALESSYLPLTLASHIGLALVTVGIAGYATSFVGRSYRPPARAAAALAALAALGGTIAGIVFLLDGQGPGALAAMEGFAGVGILAALVMIALGGESGRRPPPARSV